MARSPLRGGLEVISKRSFHSISALSPRLKSSTTGKVACGLSLGLALISAENPFF
jgi:hypothetical protein